jgi:hypothetical protein
MTTWPISLNCVLDRLTTQDDPEAWKAILDVITEEFEERYRADVHGKHPWFLRIGVCSHWWRPHQARWTLRVAGRILRQWLARTARIRLVCSPIFRW